MRPSLRTKLGATSLDPLEYIYICAFVRLSSKTDSDLSNYSVAGRKIYMSMYERDFLALRHFFSLPPAGDFSCNRLRGTQGARPGTTAQV